MSQGFTPQDYLDAASGTDGYGFIALYLHLRQRHEAIFDEDALDRWEDEGGCIYDSVEYVPAGAT